MRPHQEQTTIQKVISTRRLVILGSDRAPTLRQLFFPTPVSPGPERPGSQTKTARLKDKNVPFLRPKRPGQTQ